MDPSTVIEPEADLNNADWPKHTRDVKAEDYL